MDFTENTVAGDELFPELPADDAQAEDTMSFEDLAASLTEPSTSAETADNTGDSDPANEQAAEQTKPAGQDTKSNQIRAALRSQREQIFRDLGMSENEIRELVRAKKAEAMSAADPDISPKAAMKIIEAQEAARGGISDDDARAFVRQLADDGWSREELNAFVNDDAVRRRLDSGENMRRVATEFLRGRNAKAQQAQGRRSVPITRSASTSVLGEENRLANMSDEEYEKYSKRIDQALMEGRRISF